MNNFARYPGMNPSLESFVMEAERLTPKNVNELRDPLFRRMAQIKRDSSINLNRPKNIVVTEEKVSTASGFVKVRIYEPSNFSVKKPCLIFLHGGGWVMGDLNSHDAVCVDLSLNSRVKVCSVAYSLAPEAPYPVALNECVAVFKFLYENPDKFNINNDLIAVGGDSAGGNLALCLSLKLRSEMHPLPATNLLIYPCLGLDFETPSYKDYADAPILNKDSMIWFWQNYLSYNLECKDPLAIPNLEGNLKGMPPTILCTAEIDPLASEGEQLAKTLIENGVPLVYQQSKGMVHGFIRFREPNSVAQTEFTKMINALKYFLCI